MGRENGAGDHPCEATESASNHHNIGAFFTISQWLVGEGLCPLPRTHKIGRRCNSAPTVRYTGAWRYTSAANPRIVIASYAGGVAWQSENRTPLHSAEYLTPMNQIAALPSPSAGWGARDDNLEQERGMGGGTTPPLQKNREGCYAITTPCFFTIPRCYRRGGVIPPPVGLRRSFQKIATVLHQTAQHLAMTMLD